MGDQMFPPLVTKNGIVVGGGGGSVSNSSAAMFLQPEVLEFAPELPDVFDVMNIGVSRLDIADMICRTSLDDVERLPAIHPSVMSSRGEQVTRYISFVSSPPIETRAPRDRPRYEKRKNVLGPEDCFRCQLKTDHSACERHKFLRVGGGFRHSYSYIKQILDVIEDKSRQQAAETAKRLAKIREEQEHKAFLRATQQKRKVKTYIRTKSGKLIKQYVYITEKEYKEMKEDDVAARRILGLGDDEMLEGFTSSRKKYVVNEDGEYVEVHKIRGDSAYQESLESVRRAQEAGKGGRRRRHRRRGKGGDYSDDSDESGVGGSAEGGSHRRRHRRRRRRGRSSSSASEESYVSAGGTKHARKPRRRRHRSRDDDGQRRRRRRRSYSSSYDSGSDDVDGDGKSRRRRRRHGKHGRRRRRSYSSDDSGDEGGDKRRHRRRRRRSYSESSGSDESRRGHRRRRGRRRRSRSQGSVTGSDGSNGSRRLRRRRHRRHHSDDSDSYSDDSRSSYDSTTGSSSGGYDSDSYDSSSDGSMTYKTSSSSAVSSASSVSSVDSSDISSIEGDYTKEELKQLKQAKKERKKKEKQQAKQEQKEEMRKKIREEKRETKRTEREEKVKEKKKRREEKKKQRRKNKGKMSPVSSVSDVSSVNSDEISDVDSNLNEEQKRILIEEKKLKKKEAKKAKKFEEKYEKKKEEWKAKKKEKEKRRRVIELQKELERMSSASSIESVNSDEISSIDSDLSEGEKQRVKDKKKKKLKAERQLTKNILKAKERLKEKRKKEGRVSESDEDMDIDQMEDEEIKKAIKKFKKGKKKRGKEGIDSDSDESNDDYAYGSKDKTSRKKNKKTNEKSSKNDTIELRAPDGTRIRVNIPKSMRAAGKFVGKIRLKMDGTVAADDDEDAESVIIDEDGNLVSQPTLLINPKTIILENESWEGFQPTPPPPKTPTDGGRVKFTGIKKVLHAFRKNSEVLQKHLDEVLTTAEELNDYKQRGEKRAIFIDERDSSIDYISHYRLVEKRKLDPYGKAFVVEDDDFNCVINLNELKEAIEGIPTLQTLKPKQLEYALKVLNIDEHSLITFKMFAVMAALGERVCSMDPVSQHLIDMSDLMDIERKMELYKAMFYCNVNSERSDNHITAESLHIELRAGGLNRAQEQYVMKLMKPDEYSDISFIDYMAYIPLFLSMHENIIDNPLDMNEKYNQKSEDTNQRDMNPLGLPLRRDFMEASEKKGNTKSIRTFIEKGDLVRKESSLSPSTLPRIASSKKGSSKLSQR